MYEYFLFLATSRISGLASIKFSKISAGAETPSKISGRAQALQPPPPILYAYVSDLLLEVSSRGNLILRTYIYQSRSQSPRSSVGGIVGLWEKAQKNARNSLHSIYYRIQYTRQARNIQTS